MFCVDDRGDGTRQPVLGGRLVATMDLPVHPFPGLQAA